MCVISTQANDDWPAATAPHIQTGIGGKPPNRVNTATTARLNAVPANTHQTLAHCHLPDGLPDLSAHTPPTDSVVRKTSHTAYSLYRD